MSLFCCPKCKGSFTATKECYRCENGHVYDRAASGYVNLLPPGGKQHGDDRVMLRARREFLESGGYEPLRDAIVKTVLALSLDKTAVMLDAGCGEGYYTEAVCRAKSDIRVYGVDVSKDAVKMCDHRHMTADFAAASVYALPVSDNSCDLILSVFAPFAKEEFYRVLKSDGYLISVIPDEKHLYGLKSVLYDIPYENKLAPYEVDGFEFLGVQKVSFTLHMDTKGKIMSLYRMTPYCYRTGITGQQRIEKLDSLETEAEFQILLYRKSKLIG